MFVVVGAIGREHGQTDIEEIEQVSGVVLEKSRSPRLLCKCRSSEAFFSPSVRYSGAVHGRSRLSDQYSSCVGCLCELRASSFRSLLRFLPVCSCESKMRQLWKVLVRISSLSITSWVSTIMHTCSRTTEVRIVFIACSCAFLSWMPQSWKIRTSRSRFKLRASTMVSPNRSRAFEHRAIEKLYMINISRA